MLAAVHTLADPNAGRIGKASAILNGSVIGGASDPVQVSIERYKLVVAHELGHFFGLDHTALNVELADGVDPAGFAAVPIMCPFEVPDRRLRSHLDDIQAVSSLYPSPALQATTGTIRGQVLLRDGVTPFQGAQVIARNVADSRRLAAS